MIGSDMGYLPSHNFNIRLFYILVLLLVSGCQVSINERTQGHTQTPQEIANRMTQAYGGMLTWQSLQNIEIAREHRSVSGPTDFHFNIFADYASQRIYEKWDAPAGMMVWDGERAWSLDWPLAQRLSPRFVASIGFYLINMPWLVQQDFTKLLSVSYKTDLPSQPGKEFIVLEIELEAPSVAKPFYYKGPRDHFSLYLDPQSYLIAGVHQYRTHAGQLDNFRASAEVIAFEEIYVPTNYLDMMGLKWPEHYEIYDPQGTLTTKGRFYNYQFNQDFDESIFVPPTDNPRLIFDNSSTYQRIR
jgi:outer membrane lipoprotein-sorting protein